MKKTKLRLSAETIRNLGEIDLSRVNGGDINSHVPPPPNNDGAAPASCIRPTENPAQSDCGGP